MSVMQPLDIDSIDRLLSIDEVLSQLSIGRTLLYKMINQNKFPAPRKLGRSSRWSAQDIRKWLAENSIAA